MSKEVKKIDGLEKELYSDRERMEFWIAANWKKSAIAAVVLVIVAVAIYAVSNHMDAKKLSAENALTDTPVEKLADAIAANSDLDGVPVAELRLASYLAGKKDYKAAAARLRNVVANKKADQILVVKARMSLAAMLEASGDIAGAAAEYMALESSAASGAIQSEAGFQAGRLLIAQKKFADAEMYLSRIAAKKSDGISSFYQEQALNLLNSLKNGDFAVAEKVAAPAAKK